MEGLICSSDLHSPARQDERPSMSHLAGEMSSQLLGPEMSSARAIAQRDGPFAPAQEALGHMPGQGLGAERRRQCPGETAAPSSWSPPPWGARGGASSMSEKTVCVSSVVWTWAGARSPLLAGAAFQLREILGDGRHGCFNSGVWLEMA